MVAPRATQIPRSVEFNEWKLDDDQLHIGPQAPPKLNKCGIDQLDRIAEEIREQEHEHADVIDTDGNILGTSTNRSANMVAMQPFDDAGALKGNVFIHNHPRGNPPSSSDVIMAAHYKVAEFRLVTNHRIGGRFIGYVVRPDRFQVEATPRGRNNQILRLRSECSLSHCPLEGSNGSRRAIGPGQTRTSEPAPPFPWPRLADCAAPLSSTIWQ